jgi:hypothetical protein
MRRWERPCRLALGSRGPAMSIGRPTIRIQLGQGVDARLIPHVIGQRRDQLLDQRHLDD